MTTSYEQRWCATFMENVGRRSRTSNGEDKGSKTSDIKKPLLLQGDALKERVARNIGCLIDSVWNERLMLIPSLDGTELTVDANALETALTQCSKDRLRAMCERWYDIASDGLVDTDAYAEARAKLEEQVARTMQFMPWWCESGLNHRYRVWTPSYTTVHVPPIALEETMEKFYFWLSLGLGNDARYVAMVGSASFEVMMGTKPFGDQIAELLAWADVIMDGEVHPWLDGCSRVSTALVMWLAASFGAPPPLFSPDRREHYSTITDLAAHTEYMKACMQRTLAE